LILIYFDGLCEPKNPRGIATYAYIIKEPSGKKLEEGFGLAAKPFSESSTNNVAEYAGVVCGLKKGLKYSKDAVVLGDSALVIKQLKKEYKIRSKKLLPYYEAANNLIAQYSSLEFKWIPREENVEADSLTRRAYNLYKQGILKYKDFFKKCFFDFLQTYK
jgi:ribonuclease HI